MQAEPFLRDEQHAMMLDPGTVKIHSIDGSKEQRQLFNRCCTDQPVTNVLVGAIDPPQFFKRKPAGDDFDAVRCCIRMARAQADIEIHFHVGHALKEFLELGKHAAALQEWIAPEGLMRRAARHRLLNAHSIRLKTVRRNKSRFGPVADPSRHLCGSGNPVSMRRADSHAFHGKPRRPIFKATYGVDCASLNRRP